MKNLSFFIILILVLFSCSKNYSPSFDINGTFTHNITDCENSKNLEENCNEYIWFNDDSKDSIMFGGIDYGIPVTYKIINNQIDFYNNNGTKSEISFKIIDENNLKQIENNSIWLKQD